MLIKECKNWAEWEWSGAWVSFYQDGHLVHAAVMSADAEENKLHTTIGSVYEDDVIEVRRLDEGEAATDNYTEECDCDGCTEPYSEEEEDLFDVEADHGLSKDDHDIYEGNEEFQSEPMTPKENSSLTPRAILQEEIAEWLIEHEDVFDAPYGVLQGMHTPPSDRGKARVVTFGIARSLDASLTIWSVTRLHLEDSRGAEVDFNSADEFYTYCRTEYGVGDKD